MRSYWALQINTSFTGQSAPLISWTEPAKVQEEIRAWWLTFGRILNKQPKSLGQKFTSHSRCLPWGGAASMCIKLLNWALESVQKKLRQQTAVQRQLCSWPFLASGYCCLYFTTLESSLNHPSCIWGPAVNGFWGLQEDQASRSLDLFQRPQIPPGIKEQDSSGASSLGCGGRVRQHDPSPFTLSLPGV